MSILKVIYRTDHPPLFLFLNFRTNISKILHIFSLLFCMSWMGFADAQAQSTQWNGSADSDWFNEANGNVIVGSASTVDCNIVVDDGSIQFLSDFSLKGTFNVQTGTVNIGDPGLPVVSADFNLGGDSTFNLNNGTLNVYGSSDVGAAAVSKMKVVRSNSLANPLFQVQVP